MARRYEETRLIPSSERNTQPIMSMVPLSLREQVEKLARQSRVSMSEIGRQALTEFVEKGKKAG
jgi:hypothetical protein